MNCLHDIRSSLKVKPLATRYCHLERAVRGADAGLWEWDLLTNKVWYSPHFLELIGRTSEEFSNDLDSWSSRIHPDDRDATWSAMERHLQDEEVYEVTHRMFMKNGKYSWFRARGTAYHDENGNPVCMAGSICNIDDLKFAEQQLQEKKAQLLQQQKLDAVDSLASGIAHEFNNLLQTIRGYTQFALGSLEAESQAHTDLQQVLRAEERASILTRQLLDFSRFEEIDAQPCLIDRLIHELAGMLKPLLPRTIDLRIDLNAKSTSVLIDDQQMQQALLNLCINARDAMPEGGVLLVQSEIATLSDLYFETHPQLQPGEYIRITVTDTGKGIPQDLQQHIFEPFYTTKDIGKGTGLGLAVTLGVIQQAGGFIECSSEIDQGTTFKIHLPTSGKDLLDSSTETETNLEIGYRE